MFRKYLLPYFVYSFYWCLSKTWRVHLIEPENLKKRLTQREPIVFAHWHGDELVLVSLIKRYRISTMTSTSKDGELMTKVIKLLGGLTSRGSSTRGGVGALKGLLRLMKSGRNASMAVDGPKGPYHKVKPGVFEVSRISQSPIFTAGVAYSRGFVFKKAWNKTYLPLPFATVVIVWTEGFGAVEPHVDTRSPELALSLESQLNAAHQQASKLIATA